MLRSVFWVLVTGNLGRARCIHLRHEDSPSQKIVIVVADNRLPELALLHEFENDGRVSLASSHTQDTRENLYGRRKSFTKEDIYGVERTVSCAEDEVAYWTSNFLHTTREAERSNFDFKFFHCVDHANYTGGSENVNVHWCKTIVLQKLLRSELYDYVFVVDSDVILVSGHIKYFGELVKWLQNGTSRFLVPEENPRYANFSVGSLQNASILTGMASCQDEYPNLHCTAMIIARRGFESQSIVSAWLKEFTHETNVGVCKDQMGFNLAVGRNEDVAKHVGVLHADVLRDPLVNAANHDRCPGTELALSQNNEIIRRAMGWPNTSDITLLYHDRYKTCMKIEDLKAYLGEDMRLTLRRAHAVIEEIDFGSPLYELLAAAEIDTSLPVV